MTQSEESSKSFRESLRFLDHRLRFFSRSQLVLPAPSIPPDAPSTWSTRSGESRRPLTWSGLSKTNAGSSTPMWRLAKPASRPLKGSARQKTGLVRYLAGTRPWIPRPRPSAALPTEPTSLRIEFPKSAGREPYTATAAAAPGSRTLSGAQEEASRLRGRLPQ